MKNSYRMTTAISLFLLLTAPSIAEDAKSVVSPMSTGNDMSMKHEMGGGMGGGMGMHHGMGGMMSNMTEEQKDRHLRAMQDHMLQMHDLSNQILAEKDTAKKEALKKQQLTLMKAHHAQMMESHHQMKGMPPMQ